MVPTNTLNCGLSSIAKTTSIGGGKGRKSCGYHHQRHEACSSSCEGKRTHPQSPHNLIYNKYTEGCTFCLLSMFQQITKTQGNNSSSQTMPNDQNPRGQHSPPSNEKIQTERKRKMMEEEENKVLEMNSKIQQLKEQQEKEKASIELQQRILEYQRQQQLLEADRIQKYQLKLEEAKTQQENLRRHILNSTDFLLQTAKTSIINNTSLTDFPRVNIPFPPFVPEITTITTEQTQNTPIDNNESESEDEDDSIQHTSKSPRYFPNSNPHSQTTQKSNEEPHSSVSTTIYKPLSIQLLINEESEEVANPK
eukprot:TRINITY_DN13629_c0_g1_i1.p1 TRINITY_DN13629_c0_g1~~TRINITY_DN13629_c0_g1_i1.p1  ORF type:complete len:308 (-),score=82.86 TRINITY_DN13629_c0_g1_i1:111-1034(-)